METGESPTGRSTTSIRSRWMSSGDVSLVGTGEAGGRSARRSAGDRNAVRTASVGGRDISHDGHRGVDAVVGDASRRDGWGADTARTDGRRFGGGARRAPPGRTGRRRQFGGG